MYQFPKSSRDIWKKLNGAGIQDFKKMQGEGWGKSMENVRDGENIWARAGLIRNLRTYF
jgi:hypothetical protein